MTWVPGKKRMPAKKRKRQTKRKEEKKHTGLTSAEEKKIDAEFTYGQAGIGECLGVDRSTVARWCRQGLPYERTAHGKEHRIKLRTALHWHIGHKWATDENLELSALEKILWALAYAYANGKENAFFSHWQHRMMQEGDWFCASREEISFAIGRLSGLQCLPWR